MAALLKHHHDVFLSRSLSFFFSSTKKEKRSRAAAICSRMEIFRATRVKEREKASPHTNHHRCCREKLEASLSFSVLL
jgi:hypothetical protein